MARSYRHGKQQLKKHRGPHWTWWRQEPKWHRKIHKHRKRRAAVRQATNEVMRGNEGALFPLNTKPWVYYW